MKRKSVLLFTAGMLLICILSCSCKKQEKTETLSPLIPEAAGSRTFKFSSYEELERSLAEDAFCQKTGWPNTGNRLRLF